MWDNATYRAMAHPIKRRIITCLQDRDLSFTELLNAVVERNHGNFGHHLRTLKGFVELESSTGKYRLTHRGRLLCACIRDFRFITSVDKKLTDYVQNLEMGDHAVGFYTTEDFKHKISFPFLKAGLSKGEAVLYLVAEDELDSEMHEIQRYCIDLDCKGAFTVMSADEWYLKKSKAQPEAIIANWQTLLKEKQKAGFTGIRAAGEMEVFFNYAKTKELLRYEKSLGRQLTLNVCAMCLYDTKRLDQNQFIQVIKSHGHIISKDIVGKTPQQS